jgi:predicted MPP superfamily phosphohydrolase
LRVRIVLFISIVQSILLLAHAAVYVTWAAFWPGSVVSSTRFQLGFAFLSVSFIAASLLGYRFSNLFVRVFYTLAAAWLVMLDCLLMAACACWVVYGADRLAGTPIGASWIALALFSVALAAGIYGILNAANIRITKVTVSLHDLPQPWRGRRAAVVSDMHLGHVRGSEFAGRIAALINSLKPDIVFIVGDLFDGSAANPNGLAAPLKQLSAPFGAYFVTGNHEEFGDPTEYIRAVRGCGIEVLDNEKRFVDGLQIIGVNYRSCTHAGHFESVLKQIAIDEGRASILLLHAPNNLPVSEAAGVSLQFSGHTHRGQIFPFTWATARVYGRFVYGLHRLGRMTVFTSSGAGTWGPPGRLGTNPEVVLVQFD